MDWVERMRAEGRTLAWLAERVGVSRQYLSAVSHGRKVASPRLLRSIDRALGPSLPHPSDPAGRLDQVMVHSYRRALYLDIRDRVAGLLEETCQDLSTEDLDSLADDVLREVLESVGHGLVAMSAT